MMVPEITDSLSVLQDLLDKFTANWDGKDMRDIALHYDKSTEKLIKETVGITDEEPYACHYQHTYLFYFEGYH